jgi:hypothetical protein
MKHQLRMAIAGSTLAFVFGAGPLQAADYQYCRTYARTAMDQVRQAQSIPGCAERIRDPDRWTINYEQHFQWCMGSPPWQVQHEMDGRSRHLWRCTHGM